MPWWKQAISFKLRQQKHTAEAAAAAAIAHRKQHRQQVARHDVRPNATRQKQ
jgi:hypothetical protein